jgi:hypothetical protein
MLTWLPPCSAAVVSADQHSLVVPNSTHKAHSECQTALTKPQNKGIRSALTYKKASLPQGSQIQVRTYQEEETGKGESPSCRWYATNGSVLTMCGKPTEPGKDRCAEHGASGTIH